MSTTYNKIGGTAEESELENIELHSTPPDNSDDGKKDENSLSKKFSFTKDKLDDLWVLDLTCIVLSGLGLVGMSIFLYHFDDKPAPNWSHTIGLRSTAQKKALRITLNSILELFNRFTTISFTYILTRSLGQLTWIWFTKHERQLTDFTLFHQAVGQNEIGALKLIWKLKVK